MYSTRRTLVQFLSLHFWTALKKNNRSLFSAERPNEELQPGRREEREGEGSMIELSAVLSAIS